MLDKGKTDEQPFLLPGETIPGAPIDYPRWVRAGAVFFVLSKFFGPLSFALFVGTAVFRYRQHGQFDSVVAKWTIAGLMMILLSAGFRFWFVRYGRSRWPESEASTADSPAQAQI